MLQALVQLNAGYAIMAGGVTPKKMFKALNSDLKALSILESLNERNKESIFGAIAKEIKNINVHQLDARAFLDDELAEQGTMVHGRAKIQEHYLYQGIHVAKEIARLDIGQSIVVNRGTILAVEAFEGTDSMLLRAGLLESKESIFVKTVKPGQDYRFDVPVFGMQTLGVMEESGIKAVALEARHTIIIEKEKVLAAAKAKKITMVGYNPGVITC